MIMSSIMSSTSTSAIHRPRKVRPLLGLKNRVGKISPSSTARKAVARGRTTMRPHHTKGRSGGCRAWPAESPNSSIHRSKELTPRRNPPTRPPPADNSSQSPASPPTNGVWSPPPRAATGATLPYRSASATTPSSVSLNSPTAFHRLRPVRSRPTHQPASRPSVSAPSCKSPSRAISVSPASALNAAR